MPSRMIRSTSSKGKEAVGVKQLLSFSIVVACFWLSLACGTTSVISISDQGPVARSMVRELGPEGLFSNIRIFSSFPARVSLICQGLPNKQIVKTRLKKVSKTISKDYSLFAYF